MDRYRHIYSHRAADYHRLISSEDVDGNLLPALERVTPFRNKRVLDLGTGSGRLPLRLHQLENQLIGLDLHAGMLQENMRQRALRGGAWELLQADIRALPFPNRWAEIIIAGWSIGHSRGWYAREWQTQIGRMLTEMHRVVNSPGTLIIIETLTTGSLTPTPPTPALAEYYAWLENDWGFTRQEISTDYLFDSVEQAAATTEFFFGQSLAATIRQEGWNRVPEWTGVWSKLV